ncbi:uncharacterized protein [Arachis hypogaea]|uniref:uncharacterized protein n=1 Tax=Arachis hypogaea TaxID=3818 RepID=UPI000DEC32DF|nr:uncharacterized protein LOC112794723 [Arachis hypogaea]
MQTVRSSSYNRWEKTIKKPSNRSITGRLGRIGNQPPSEAKEPQTLALHHRRRSEVVSTTAVHRSLAHPLLPLSRVRNPVTRQILFVFTGFSNPGVPHKIEWGLVSSFFLFFPFFPKPPFLSLSPASRIPSVLGFSPQPKELSLLPRHRQSRFLLSKLPSLLFLLKVSVLYSSDLRKLVDEVKELGFDPSSVKFAIALLAKKTIRKSLWDAKVDILKSWGWSKETTSQAFWRNPLCMLSSKDKINEVMKLWVNQLGWDPLALAKIPWLFGYNLERRIIPRAFVLQYLLSRGLRNKNDNLSTPFYVSEELFFNKFVECFTEERSQLRKIYYEKKGCS